jgi:hypothetical protein
MMTMKPCRCQNYMHADKSIQRTCKTKEIRSNHPWHVLKVAQVFGYANQRRSDNWCLEVREKRREQNSEL